MLNGTGATQTRQRGPRRAGPPAAAARAAGQLQWPTNLKRRSGRPRGRRSRQTQRAAKAAGRAGRRRNPPRPPATRTAQQPAARRPARQTRGQSGHTRLRPQLRHTAQWLRPGAASGARAPGGIGSIYCPPIPTPPPERTPAVRSTSGRSAGCCAAAPRRAGALVACRSGPAHGRAAAGDPPAAARVLDWWRTPAAARGCWPGLPAAHAAAPSKPTRRTRRSRAAAARALVVTAALGLARGPRSGRGRRGRRQRPTRLGEHDAARRGRPAAVMAHGTGLWRSTVS